jgi:imidazolonepropionase-like amidohydrolase
MITFENARVFDGTTLLKGRHSVTVDGTNIVAIDAPPPANAQRVGLAGMTLLPGFITSHFHADFYKFTLNVAMTGMQLGKELPPGVGVAMGVRQCRVLLESGFTGYLGAACANYLDSQLKIAIAENIIPGPRIRACGHHLNTTGSANDRPQWWQQYDEPGIDVFADGPDELRKVVRDQIRHGCETIKIFGSPGHLIIGPKISRQYSWDELKAICDAAHERGAIVRSHACERDVILENIKAGVDIIDHGDEVDEACIEAMVKAGTYWVPSLFFATACRDAGLEGTDFEFIKICKDVSRALPLAHKAGVKILIGDDYSGFLRDIVKDDPTDHTVGNYGREFAFYAKFDGVKAEDVLQWGTRNPGELLSNGAKVGVIAPGAKADMIVVDGDPLANLDLLWQPRQALKMVMVDGRTHIDRMPPSPLRAAAE